MYEFKLHDLGEGMQEAEIRRWLVNPGDEVRRDQPMVEVETDKAVVEIPSPIAGRVAEIRTPAGSVAKVGQVLVTFETADAPRVPVAATAGSSSINGAQQTAVAASTPTTKTRVLAAPAVRKRAFELNIDLEQVPPSQPNGRVTLEDVVAYAERLQQQPTAEPTTKASPASVPESTSSETEERQPLTGLRRRIAERMERSWRSIPHATTFDELDGTALIALRQVLKPVAEQRGVRLTYMPLLVKLLIPVLKEYPIFNASLDEEKREIVYKRSYHIGIAADSPEGLLVPVLRHADQLTLIQLAQKLEHLIAGAQKRTLALDEVAGSTFTLNNVGSFGGSSGTPIINYPEAAILAVGRLQVKAIVRNGTIVACPMMPLALSFDHRLIDGALAGKFLGRFKELVEQPQQIMLDML
jgi:pyruvate dehydrogenase E2 component (dihydrolipoamide acetyltransferase)